MEKIEKFNLNTKETSSEFNYKSRRTSPHQVKNETHQLICCFRTSQRNSTKDEDLSF
jgi:hypothetical protein